VGSQSIRGLTLWRPWAWAVAHAGKDVENRTWAPPRALVGGLVAIHSGQRWDKDGAAWMQHSLALRLALRVPEDAADPSGVIIAVARLAGAVESSSSQWFVGPFGWQLRDVVPIPPVPCKGAQGLWPLPPEVLSLVRERFRAARAEVRHG
jgi:hypothetical protein